MMIHRMDKKDTELDSFLRELEFSGLSEGTKMGYLCVAKKYLQNGRGFDRDSIIQFLQQLKGGSTYKAWCLAVLKRLFQSQEKTWPLRPREGPKPQERPQVALSEIQARTLLTKAKKSARDYAIFRLLVVTGIRRGELVALRREDFKPPELKVQLKKRESYRVIKLDSETVQTINNYLKSRKDKLDQFFLSQSGKTLTPVGLSLELQHYFKEMGLPKGTGLHSLRRGMVTWLFNRGMKELEIQELIGWKSSTMPAKYIKLAVADVEKKAQSLHPFIQRG